MIVKCEQCQTKFKIPDDKVTPQGVKVRCTKCQHTFRVKKEVEAAAGDPFEALMNGPPPQAPPPMPPPVRQESAPPVSSFLFDGLGDDLDSQGPASFPHPPAPKSAGGSLLSDIPEADDPFHGGESAAPVDGARDRSMFAMPVEPAAPAAKPQPPSQKRPPPAAPAAPPRSTTGGMAIGIMRASPAAPAPQTPPEAPKPPWTKAFTSAADVTLSAAVTAFLVLGVAALLTGGSVEGSAFSLKRLSSLFTSPAPLAARDVSNGLYDTRVGRPLFYVRGEVVNQGKTPQRARVRAEILEDDQLVRAAEGSAGNAASPEDLYGVSSGADVEALQARLEAAPAFIPPGGTASFLVPFYEYPPDPSRFRLRLSVWNPEAPPKAAASR